MVTMNEKSHLPAPSAPVAAGENVNPAPERISPEKRRKIALFAICPKTQIKRTNQQPAEERRKQPREAGAEPRTLPRQDGEKHSRSIDPAQIIDGAKGSEQPAIF